jgi:hypothetical protein
MDALEEAIQSVDREVRSAMKLHPPMNSHHEAYAVIKEEFEEYWEEVKVNPNKLKLGEQLARIEHMRKELIQVAAMAIRTIADLGL